MDYPEYPTRYEDEYPESAAFMARVFSAGGKFKYPQGKLNVREIPRNAQCPCGSGKKTKICHVEWTEN